MVAQLFSHQKKIKLVNREIQLTRRTLDYRDVGLDRRISLVLESAEPARPFPGVRGQDVDGVVKTAEEQTGTNAARPNCVSSYAAMMDTVSLDGPSDKSRGEINSDVRTRQALDRTASRTTESRFKINAWRNSLDDRCRGAQWIRRSLSEANGGTDPLKSLKRTERARWQW